MTITFTLSPDVERRLEGAALRQGMDVAQYASRLIAEHLPPEPEDDDATRLRGVVPVTNSRPAIFSEPLGLSVESLPKWSPHVTISPRALAEAGDE